MTRIASFLILSIATAMLILGIVAIAHGIDHDNVWIGVIGALLAWIGLKILKGPS